MSPFIVLMVTIFGVFLFEVIVSKPEVPALLSKYVPNGASTLSKRFVHFYFE